MQLNSYRQNTNQDLFRKIYLRNISLQFAHATHLKLKLFVYTLYTERMYNLNISLRLILKCIICNTWTLTADTLVHKVYHLGNGNVSTRPVRLQSKAPKRQSTVLSTCHRGPTSTASSSVSHAISSPLVVCVPE